MWLYASRIQKTPYSTPISEDPCMMLASSNNGLSLLPDI